MWLSHRPCDVLAMATLIFDPALPPACASRMCSPDPGKARVGSGGATFNSLITVQELLSGRVDGTPDDCIEENLADSLVFMIHSGGDSQRLPCQSVCGKAWSALPLLNAETGYLEVRVTLPWAGWPWPCRLIDVCQFHACRGGTSWWRGRRRLTSCWSSCCDCSKT